MATLRTEDGIAAKTLEFLILTVGRTSEVIGAEWPEIDFKAKTWNVLARNFGVLMLVLCHPSKGDQRTRDRRPELEDIAGSKHRDNIPDQGLSIYRPKVFDNGECKTEAQLFHLKTRFEELGHECRLDLKYDLSTGRFRSTAYEVAMPRQKPRGNDDA